MKSTVIWILVLNLILINSIIMAMSQIDHVPVCVTMIYSQLS